MKIYLYVFYAYHFLWCVFISCVTAIAMLHFLFMYKHVFAVGKLSVFPALSWGRDHYLMCLIYSCAAVNPTKLLFLETETKIKDQAISNSVMKGPFIQIKAVSHVQKWHFEFLKRVIFENILIYYSSLA